MRTDGRAWRGMRRKGKTCFGEKDGDCHHIGFWSTVHSLTQSRRLGRNGIKTGHMCTAPHHGQARDGGTSQESKANHPLSLSLNLSFSLRSSSSTTGIITSSNAERVHVSSSRRGLSSTERYLMNFSQSCRRHSREGLNLAKFGAAF